MKRTLTFFLVALFIAVTVPVVGASEFEDQLKKLVGQNAEGYIGPFSTAFGTAMNSGLYHTGKTHGMLGFDVSIKMAFISISDEDLEFDFFLDDITMDISGLSLAEKEITIDLNDVYPDRTQPTVFGGSGNAIDPTGADATLSAALLGAGMSDIALEALKTQTEWDVLLAQFVSIPGIKGIDLDFMPLVLPQASVGLPFGTEVMLRFLPTISTDDFGDINFMGFGISHSLSQYIPIPLLFPVDITAQFVSQKLEIGDLLESNHSSFGVRASLTVGIGFTVTPYVGVAFESSDLKVDYTVDDPGSLFHGQNISLDLDGDNGTRMTAGVRLGLPLMTINVDYSLGEYSAISAGLGLTLR